MDNELIKVCIGVIILSLWLYSNIYYDGFRGIINSFMFIILGLGIHAHEENNKSMDIRLKQIEELIYDKPEDINIEIS